MTASPRQNCRVRRLSTNVMADLHPLGVDARGSVRTRSWRIPTQGGSGLAISTWLGDLGGGAGTLALRRATRASTSVQLAFSGSDYGGCINLEGDVAGYVVAQDPTVENEPSAPVFAAGRTFADALEAYLSPGSTSVHWKRRARRFLKMLGARFDQSSLLANEAALRASLASDIADFGAWYLATRLGDHSKADPGVMREASRHLDGAATEVAEVFVHTLVRVQLQGEYALAAVAPFPKPTPPKAAGGLLSIPADLEDKAKAVPNEVGDRAKDFLKGLFGD